MAAGTSSSPARRAHLLTTMDTPTWVYRWIYKSPGLNSLALATLGFAA